MQVIKKIGQKYPSNVNRITGEYEIKTFSGNQRNTSPLEASSQNVRRSPNRIYEQGNSESAFGEMIYLEPNEMNFRRGQNMSPLNDSHNMIIRSPNEGTGGIINMQQRMNYNNPRFQQSSIEEGKEAFSRSPKTINIGESPQEMEYNIKTFNRRNNNTNMNINSPQNNYIADRSYNMVLNDSGNIFLDQPMQQAYNQQNDGYMSNNAQRGNSMEQNSREIQFGMNPRDLQEPLTGVLRKMSPKGNVEGDSDSNSDKNDNVNQIRDLKSQLDRNAHHVMFKNEDGIGLGEKSRQNRGDMENIEIMAKTREFQENVTGDEVKKLIKYYVKTYDPHKGEDGNLISNSQTIILSNQDQLFNDRYRVLQKMNKLSNILLSKNRSGSPDSGSLNRSLGEEGKNKFDKSVLNTTGIKGFKKPRRNKFVYISLAMLSAKGPNTEDRTILRRMRLDKGGVVDLAQETLQKKSKFKIKKARAGGRGITTINPKYREKAAKIVQAWWRERKEKYKKILEQIIKIQSVWRGKFTRKYIYDVIYISYLHEKFFSIMGHVLVNHVRPIVFDELFSRNRLIKDILKDLILKYDRRYDLLRLKYYFLKWRENSDFLKRRQSIYKDLLKKKEQNESNLSILKKYFDKWATITNLYKYIGKAKNAEEKRQKFFGALNMINGLSNLSKRQVFKHTKEPISNYLKDLLKQKILIKILKTISKKCLQSKLNYYLNKWRINAEKKKLEDFKKEVFLNIINHMDSRLDKIKMKYYLDKWKRHIPRYRKILDIKDGSEILSKLALKKNLQYPVRAFAEKINGINKREATQKMLKIEGRKLRDELRYYFNKWKNNKIRLDDKDKRNEIYKNLLKNLINKINMRILQKRFNQWRTRPKVDINGEMRKINDFTIILHETLKNHYNDDYTKFLDRLNKTRAPHSLKNAASKLFKIFNNKRGIILRYYLYRWRSQAKTDELKELHRQLLRYIITSMQAKNNRNTLGKYLTRWRLFVGDNQNYDNLDKLKQVLRGGDLLDKIHKRRLRDLVNRLYIKLGKDYRPKILAKLIKNIDKPRSSLRELFDRWRRVVEKDKDDTDIKKYKAKIMDIKVNDWKKRTDRDKLMRAFFHWRAMSKKPEEYYPRINNLIESLNRYIKKKATNEPFDLIKISRNPTRHLLKLLKNYDNQEKRLLDGKLRNLLGRWRKATSDTNAKNLKARILYNIKVYLDELEKKKLLSKYFTNWKLNSRKKGIDLNFVKGIEKLNKIFKAPAKKIVYKVFTNKIKDDFKQKGVNDLVKLVDNHKNKILHKTLLELWKKTATIDPNKATKIKTKLRKIIKYSEMEPRTRAFKKWVKVVQTIKLRDKDLYHATKVIGGFLRNNDKMNLYNALNRWRNKIHQLREQYLKALLIKQIKTAQDIKDKMSNESKLRAALLKWRTNLISLNYLDNIKKIRRGCKLFKLGLKKLHERDIVDNLKNISKENGKGIMLKKIINITIPNLERFKLRRSLNIWKSKLGDTEKMKTKINNLFDDYIYSDKVHKGIFKKPKEDLLNLFKQYNDMKKDAAKKISKFVKEIQKIPEINKKMKRIKLLDDILKKKQKILDDIKKMYLIRFHRLAEKDKMNENASIIQKFIKRKLKKLFDKKNLIKQGIDKFDIFIKRSCLEKIKDSSKKNHTDTLLNKIIHKKDDKNNDNLRFAFNEWRNKIPKLKRLDSIITIQNNYRTYIAKKNLNNLKLRILLLKKIHEINEKINKNKLEAYMRKWLHNALMTKNDDAARTIQKIYKQRLEKKKNNIADDKLKNIFKKYTKHELAKVLEKLSKVIGGKGLVIYNSIQDILYRKPFNKLINNLNLIRRVNTLEKLQPKIHDTLKKYYLPKVLKKWKENTYDQTIKHTINLQKFLRDQYNKKLARDKVKRETMLVEIINRKIKNDLYKLKLPFNIWHKKAKLEKMNENATKIQNKFRESLAVKKAKNLKALNKCLNLVKIIKSKEIFDVLKTVKENKVTEDKRKKLLISILSKQTFINDKLNLENSFKKWKKIIQLAKDGATKIANAFRSYLARKEKNRLKKINDLLKKYVLKHEKNDNDLQRSKLRKWYNKVMLEDIIDKVIFIQRFMKPKLAKIQNDKLKKFFSDKARKKIDKLLLLAGKVNKLQRAINKPTVHKFVTHLEVIHKDKNRDFILKKAIKDINDKISHNKLKNFWDRWKDQHKKLVDKYNNSILIIQRNYRISKAVKEKNRLMDIKNLLTKFITDKDKIINNKLFSALRKWAAITKNLNLNDSALTIQKHWRKFKDKLDNDKELARKLKIQNGLEKLFNIKFGSRFVLDKIDSERKRNIFIKFNNDLKKKKIDTLRNCFDNIDIRACDNVLIKALQVPDEFKKRILRKSLKILKDKTDKLAKKHCADIIIKNWRIHSNNKKQENKKGSLEKILGNIILKNSNVLKNVFRRWNDIAKKMRNEQNRQRIAKFFEDRLRIANARKNWKNLSNKLSLKDRNANVFELINKLKKLILLNRFKTHFKVIVRKQFFDKTKDNKKNTITYEKLIDLLPKMNEKNNNIILKKYLIKWINNVDKLNDREDKLKNALDTISKKQDLKNVEDINRIMIIKKLFHDIPLIRAKYFIQRIRENADKKNKYNKLVEDVLKSKEDLDSQNKEKILNKLYKLYFYNKINGLLNACKKYDNRLRNIYGKDFLSKLFSIKNKFSTYKYNNKQESISQAKITNLKFKNKVKKNNDVNSDINAPMKKVLPSLVKYLQNLINRRNEDTYEKVKSELTSKSFINLLKNFNNKTIEPTKREYIKKIRREAKYSQTRPIYQAKLYKLFRKKYIKYIKTTLVKPSRLYKLFYLINLTKMHTNIAAQRYQRELIRKWRFISFTKKMARKKLELMYKNLHASYLQMADEIFGEDKVNPSVFKEFEKFGSNVGMFTGQEPEIDEELNKKYYTAVDKKYVFTKRASMILTEAQAQKNEEYVEKIMEGYEEVKEEEDEGEIKRSSTQKPKFVKEESDSIKKSDKYFPKK